MSLRMAGVEHLSPSGADRLITCERAYWWRYARKLGKDERSEPLAMGGGLALAIELGNLDAGIAEYHRKRPAVDAFTDPEADQRAIWIAEATIREVFKGYNLRYQDPPELIREETYLCSLPGTDRILQVRVDGVVPEQYLVEDKLRSGSSLRAEDIENERMQGLQLTAEIYGRWRVTKGEELLPLRFRNTKKIDPRKLKPTRERPEISKDYIETTLAEWFEGDVFYEWTVTRTVEQLRLFEAEFADLAARASELLSPDTGHGLVLPVAAGPRGRRNTKACTMYGRTCPAIAHCQGSLDEQTLLIQQGIIEAPGEPQQQFEVTA